MVEQLESLSIGPLSRILDIPEKTLRKWVFEKKIPYYKLGGRVLFNRAEIAMWYASKKVAPLTDTIINEKMRTNPNAQKIWQ